MCVCVCVYLPLFSETRNSFQRERKRESERARENKKGRRLISYAAGTIERNTRLYSTLRLTDWLTDVAMVGKSRQSLHTSLHTTFALFCCALHFVACGHANEWKSQSLKRRETTEKLNCCHGRNVSINCCMLSPLCPFWPYSTVSSWKNEFNVDLVSTEHARKQAPRCLSFIHISTSECVDWTELNCTPLLFLSLSRSI